MLSINFLSKDFSDTGSIMNIGLDFSFKDVKISGKMVRLINKNNIEMQL